MRTRNAFSLTLIACALAACGPAGPTPAELEAQRLAAAQIADINMGISRNNAQKNADSYRVVVFPDSSRALVDADSTISPQCRNGDGWASGYIEFPPETKKPRVKIKCQTNGTGKGINGCLTEADFQTKVYKSEEGTCQNLPTLDKFK